MAFHHPFLCALLVGLCLSLSSAVLAQDEGRDIHFDNTLLFTEPWLWPVNLDALVPQPKTGPKPTYAQSWLAASEPEKDLFLEGYGDQVMFRCLARGGGDNPGSQACVKPLLPLPPELVLAAMDDIYRDPAFANKRYDLVIQAALKKIVGEDWRGFLAR